MTLAWHFKKIVCNWSDNRNLEWDKLKLKSHHHKACRAASDWDFHLLSVLPLRELAQYFAGKQHSSIFTDVAFSILSTDKREQNQSVEVTSCLKLGLILSSKFFSQVYCNDLTREFLFPDKIKIHKADHYMSVIRHKRPISRNKSLDKAFNVEQFIYLQNTKEKSAWVKLAYRN